MKSLSSFLLMVCVVIGSSNNVFAGVYDKAFGGASINPEIYFTEARSAVIRGMTFSGLNWKVGDKLHFKVSMKPIRIKGAATLEVVQIAEEGVLIVQHVELGFLGSQHTETLVDKRTGQVLKVVLNGKEVAVPEPDAGLKIVKQEVAQVTVPAGTFECLYIVKEDEKKRRSEIWVNPMAVPINGVLKTVQVKLKPFTTITELLSFERGR